MRARGANRRINPLAAIAVAALLLSLSTYVCAGTDPTEQQLAEFKAVYAEYEAAVAAKDNELTVKKAARTVALATDYLGEANPSTAVVTYNYGIALAEVREIKLARRVLRTALTRFEKAYGKNAPESLSLLFDLANYSDNVGYTASRERYIRRYVDLAKTVYGAESMEAARAMVRAGMLAGGIHAGKPGLRYQRQAYGIYTELLDPLDPEMAWAEFHLAKMLLVKRRDDEAELHFKNALANMEAQQEAGDHPLKMTTMAFLIELYEQSDRSALATEYCLAIGRMTPFSDTQNFFPLFRKAPKYPLKAQRMGREGQVLVEFVVDEMGFVTDPEVVHFVGGDVFVPRALEAVQGFRYAPRFVDGVAVATPGVQNIITFELVD